MADNFTISTASGTVVIRTKQLPGGEHAQMLFTAPMQSAPVGPPEKLSVGTGAVVSLSPPGTATHAIVTVETNSVRWYDDGTNPTTGVSGNGPMLIAGDVLEVTSPSTFKMISVSGTATVHVTYRRYA